MASALSPDTVDGLAPLVEGAGAVTATPTLPVGTRLADGRYEIGAPLGRGGFGVTYAATDTRLRRAVAIKELLPEGATRVGVDVRVSAGAEPGFASAWTRFLREATTLARFGHPNIVRIFAVFEENATAYLVLEHLVGRTLAAELRARRGPLTEAEGLEVAGQVAAALAAVHRAGVLHRDVSPANLIRTDDGRTVLIDFGLARPFAADHTTMMTRIVTPGYAPPEQHAGAGRFSARADVYALGATLHRILSGATPPPASDRRADDALTPLWRLNPTVSRRTSDAVAAALALDPAERPATVTALIDQLGVDRAGLDLLGPDEEDVPAPVVDLTGATAVVAPNGPDLAKAEAPVPADGPAAVPTDSSWRPDELPPPAALAAGGSQGLDELPPTTALAGGGSWVVPAPVETEVVVPPPADRRRDHGAAAPVVEPVAVGPRAVGPAAGRRWITIPLGLAAVGLTAAQPITFTVILGLVVAPIVATVGDVLARPERSPAWAPLWWIRNLGIGLVRSLGALVVLVVGLCLWFGTEAFDGLADLGPWVLRVTGIAAGSLLAVSMARGGSAFRSDVALDALARRLMPRGRPTVAAAVVALVGIAVAAAGFAFTPEAWPLR